VALLFSERYKAACATIIDGKNVQLP
jgi:hypothetical protein